MKEFYKSIWFGLLLGTAVPIIGSALVLIAFEQLSKMGIIQSNMGSFSIEQERTIYVLGILINLIPFQYFKYKKEEKVMSGIVTMTIIAVIAWVIYYYKTLL
jgi:amino acid permease